MKKLLVYIIVFLCTSCSSKEVIECSSYFYIYNKTGQTIEIFKGSASRIELKNEDITCLYSTKLSSDLKEVLFEKIMQEHGEKFKDISVYGVIDGERKFLKKWTFAERNDTGKQLYRLSDSELYINEQKYGSLYDNIVYFTPFEKRRTEITYEYTFTINTEDVGL